MPGFSDYLENKIIDHFLRAQASAAPTTVYASLCTADPTDAGSGGGTVTSRVAVTFSAPADGVSSNTGTVTFPSVAAGAYAYVRIDDAASAGNMLYSGPLSATKNADAGDTITFAAGQLTVTNT